VRSLLKVVIAGTVLFTVNPGCTRAKSTDREGRTESSTVKLFSSEKKGYIMAEKVKKTDEEWKKQLTPEEYEVTREKGTELPYSGELLNNKRKGMYKCVCCGTDLFSSDTKFESGTGWPSFWAPVDSNNVALETDESFFMTRTEVLCSRCDAHLGHVFKDGPDPTGLRYCMNSVSLKFEESK